MSLLVVLMLGGALAMSAEAPTAAVAAPRQAAKVRGGERLLAGWALVDRDLRVRGGRVRVVDRRGRSLVAQGTHPKTTRFGTFSVRLRRALPQRFVVSVSGGRAGKRRFRGTLRTIAHRSRSGVELVHVNPVSTIVVAHARRYPRGGLVRARRNVRRILRLRRDQDLEAGLRRTSAPFDGVRFLRAARKHGGLNRYAAALARRAARHGKPLSFRSQPVKRKRAKSSAESGGIAQAIMTALLDGLVEGPEDDAIGWVLDGIGFGGDENNQLDAIASQLNELLAITEQIEQQVSELRAQVTRLEAELTRGEYSTLVANFPASDVGSDEDQVLTDLSWLVEHAAGDCAPSQLAGCVGSIPAGKDPVGWCASSDEKDNSYEKVACDALLRIQARDLDNTLPKSIDDVTGSAGADGILTVYQQSKFASLAAANGFVTGDYYNDSAQIYGHFAAIEALQSDYLTQFWNAEGQPADLLTTKLKAFQSDIQAQASLLPRIVPYATAIQAATGRMWGFALAPRLPSGSPGVGECVNGTSRFLWWWHLKSPSAACQSYMDSALNQNDGLGGWALPSLADLGALPGTGSGVPNDTLVNLMKLPDTTDDAKAVRIPGPNPSVLTADVPTDGNYFGNPGAAFGVASSDCIDHMIWNSGLSAIGPGYESPVFAQGRGCKYIDLATGRIRTQCVWGDPGYYGCDMPASRVEQNRIGAGTPIDYGHPLVVLLWRTPAASEGWFKQ